jgi:hypothetical protein
MKGIVFPYSILLVCFLSVVVQAIFHLAPIPIVCIDKLMKIYPEACGQDVRLSPTLEPRSKRSELKSLLTAS